MAGVYNLDNDMKSVKDLRDELIGKVRNSMKAVFGDLLLKDIADPTQGGAFFFERGTVKKYHYKNLSGGEKGAFDILLDLHVKKQYFDDAIYCIDEIETHLHTRVQGKLLKEMVAVLPQKSQLWITTHSLGVMRAALELEKEQPGSVSIIDFDGIDPDVPREIEPSNIGRATWDKLLSIALDDLSVMVAPNHVVVCEGSSIGSRRKDFDAEIYNKIFRQSTNSVIFVSGGGSEQVKATGVSVGNTIAAILPGSKVYSLTDRDDRSDDEVQRLRQEGQLILDQRNMESYLFSDEVIEALVKTSNRIENETTTTTESFSTALEALIDQALKMKKQAIEESISRGNPADDLKSASGPIFNSLKRLLQLTRCGNNKDEFMRDTLAPLITPTMSCYQDLKTCILDQML
jgi:hypothetical protein